MADEAALATAEAIKRFRAAVRLELSIAGDYVIGRHLKEIKDLAAREIASGGIPALENGMGSKAKQIADGLSRVFEAEIESVLKALPAGSSDDSSA